MSLSLLLVALTTARCDDIALEKGDNTKKSDVDTSVDTLGETSTDLDTVATEIEEEMPWQCADDEACEGAVVVSGECEYAKCDGGECVVGYMAAGTDCTEGETDECTSLACDGSGTCVAISVDDGTPCDDEDPCTTLDTCVDGVCTAGEPVICEPLDLCHDAGTCDPSTGECTTPVVDDGTPCDDGNDATGSDACQAGVCLGEGCSCSTVDDCCDGCLPDNEGDTCADDTLECTDDVCVQGVCTHEVVGTHCAIEDVCYQDGDPNPDNDCQYCDSVFSGAQWRDVSNGTDCDDGDPDSGDDVCQDGQCVGVSCVCAVEGPCCDGCSSTNDGGACAGDDISCTDDSCADGVCAHAITAGYCLIEGVCYLDGAGNPANACEYCDSVFDTQSWRAKGDSTPCDDGNPCTEGGSCSDGVCQSGSTIDCTALDQCHVAGTCDPASGECSTPARDDGVSCDDGDPCTEADTCQAGICTGGDDVVCEFPPAGVTALHDQCWLAGICNSVTGACEYEPVADGISCDDGDPSTGYDSCQSGACVGDGCWCSDELSPGVENPCCQDCLPAPGMIGAPCVDDDISCTSDVCDTSGNCVHELESGFCIIDATCFEDAAPNPDNDCQKCDTLASTDAWVPMTSGTTCTDGDACTEGDTCTDGACSGVAISCDDGNVCTTDSCDPATGCLHESNDASCDDGNACTVQDQCSGGACGGSAMSCEAPAACQQAGICDPSTGVCEYAEQPDGTECYDGSTSTYWEWCQSGVCACRPLTEADLTDELGLDEPLASGGPCGTWLDGCGEELMDFSGPCDFSLHTCGIPITGKDGSTLGMVCGPP